MFSLTDAAMVSAREMPHSKQLKKIQKSYCKQIASYFDIMLTDSQIIVTHLLWICKLLAGDAIRSF